MTTLFDLLYGLALVVLWPLLIVRRLRRGPGSLALGERLGDVPSRPVSGRCVWIHGVSLGEINATPTLVRMLRERDPELVVAISSTTATGLARAHALYPELTVFRFPIDLSLAVRRAFDRIRPSAIVLMELELWPNLMEVAAGRGVPLLVANGRITEEKSMRRFRLPLLRSLARRMFSRLSWVGAQDETYAGRFVELGTPAERVAVTGTTKYDTAQISDSVPGQDELAAEMGMTLEQPLLVCGSTGPEEEALLLGAYRRLRERHADLQLSIIPRKPERFDEVADLIVATGYACLRRSTGAPHRSAGGGAESAEAPPVFLGDTLGELRKFYALATVAFVGRSLVPMGGSDMLEAAALAKPVIVGPHTDNFAAAMRLLSETRGVRVVRDAHELVAAVSELLRHPDRAAAIGAAGREAIVTQRGATRRIVEAIFDRLPPK
jgi:3-deoxy-D-manno-octulosonic-acid transferase